MRLQLQRAGIAFSLIVLLSAFEFCTSNNATWISSRDKKTRIVRKLRKDFRKLKKQEGALKLIGGENGEYEGARQNSFYDLILKIFVDNRANDSLEKHRREKNHLKIIGTRLSLDKRR